MNNWCKGGPPGTQYGVTNKVNENTNAFYICIEMFFLMSYESFCKQLIIFFNLGLDDHRNVRILARKYVHPINIALEQTSSISGRWTYIAHQCENYQSIKSTSNHLPYALQPLQSCTSASRRSSVQCRKARLVENRLESFQKRK